MTRNLVASLRLTVVAAACRLSLCQPQAPLAAQAAGPCPSHGRRSGPCPGHGRRSTAGGLVNAEGWAKNGVSGKE